MIAFGSGRSANAQRPALLCAAISWATQYGGWTGWPSGLSEANANPVAINAVPRSMRDPA
ncbi:hypothetical protein chiPu_0031265, partial [Chiloscyllium punctatum]|nr:hypothetical protein [Chiloscyllium punctatum]